MGRHSRAGRGVAWALLAGLGGATAVAAPTASVQFAPTPLQGPDARVLVYELDVGNFAGIECVRLARVRMQAGQGAATMTTLLAGAELLGNMIVYDAAVQKVDLAPQDPIDIPAGGGALIYLFVPLAVSLPTPVVLHHALDFGACRDDAGPGETVSVEVPVSTTPPVVVGMPFSGSGWVASDSSNEHGIHRRVAIPLRDATGQPLPGQFHVPERYAIDWVKVDAQGRRTTGPANENASYLAYGLDVLAAADGPIVATRDGMPDGTPPYNPPNATMETAAGNYIMQDIGGGNYAFYAHLIPGSQTVTQGQMVRRGDVIARLGNSGNSSEPHLHFHVSDHPDPLLSEGRPYVFDQFQITGQADGMNDINGLFEHFLTHPPRLMRKVMPRSFSIIDTALARAAPQPLPPPALVLPRRR